MIEMNIDTIVTRFMPRKDIVIPYKTLEKAADEAIDYKYSKVSKGHFVVETGKEPAYIIIERGGEIGCSCPSHTFNRGGEPNDGCKHLAVFLKRSKPPDATPSAEVLTALKAAGWTGLSLHPPATATSDPSGEEDTDLVPGEDPEHDPVPAPGLGETEEEHIAELEETSSGERIANVGNTIEPEPPQEEPKMEEEETEKKKYEHPDGTVFETVDALLSYITDLKESKPAAQVPARRVQHKPMIKGISPQLQEIGRIAVGEKGGRSKSGKTRLPTKLDHFIFTTLDKDEDDGYIRDAGMMAAFGDKCTEIPIRLLYNDIELNFPTFYAKYTRSGIKLRGDGENWTVYNVDANGNGTREEVFDPNNERGFLDDPDVKPHGILTVLVEGQNSVGGVFKFRTTSWNSINNILSSLALIKNMCGMLTYIPLKLVYRRKEVQPEGMAHKTWIPVVSVEFRGTIEELQAQASEVRQYMTTGQRAETQQIEAAVREHLIEDEPVEVQKDIAAEFAPGAV